MSKHMIIGWGLFVSCTIVQALMFAVPDAGYPPAAAYVYGTVHGGIWLWILSREGAA